MRYAFKGAARAVRGLDAEVVGRTLEDIAGECGSVTPAAVVEVARPEEHPLHGYFTWDDAEAAAKHREAQAAYLIRAVVVVHEQSGSEVRAFIHVEGADAPPDEGLAVKVGDYRPVDVVMADPDLRSRVLHRALVDLQAWERKYANLSELNEVLRAAARVREQLGADAAV